MVSLQQIADFQSLIYTHFEAYGRDFPWRHTNDPYAILVAEVMSQQTQIERVIPKYQRWMKAWPTISALAQSQLISVLQLWSGLGYNRRAKWLHQISRIIVTDFGSKIPSDKKSLLALPGIGLYTATAIRAFAFNVPEVAIDTNIRNIYIHHFFPSKEKVTDEALLPFIEATKDATRPKMWLSALMDYGAYLKSQGFNEARKSLHYVKQEPLKGSVREVRGFIIAYLTTHRTTSRIKLTQFFQEDNVKQAIVGLRREGIIEVQSGIIRIAQDEGIEPKP